ncbi:MAG: type II toxin-antitoxin system HicA family toxin [Candidatus Gracilibacteria bacterium]|nr:type II toxin-antitoxin system HicA family toxin [Candidatus Gracilibacteria bacterium]
MLKPIKPKEVLSKLEKLGFTISRQTGSHIVLKLEGKTVILPFHGGKDIPIPTLKSVLKQAGINENQF